MFDELNRFTGWHQLPTETFILLSQDDVDGSFLIHHFIAMYLKANKSVILITAAQTFSHYAVACSKLGVNLERSKNSGKLKVIDFLDYGLQSYGLQDKDVADFGEFSIKSLYLNVIQNLDNDKNTIIILDDITVLQNIGLELNDLTGFVHYMKGVCSSRDSVFVTQIYKDNESLYNYCKFHCETEICTKGLPSGYSKDVHGSIILSKKEENNFVTVENVSEMQYRVTDRNLKLFAIGTSSAVL